MKVAFKRPETPPVFRPIGITFTIENEEEAKAFYFLCNYVPLIEVLGIRPVCDAVRDEIRQACAGCTDSPYTGYSALVDKLKKAVK